MQNWRDIPMPKGIRDLPRDDRGFPITFVTLIGSDGRPDFTTIDAEKIWACVRGFLCGLCGREMVNFNTAYEKDEMVAFIGGPLSVENRNFLDPPMHEPCAAYAMQVCPHIVHDTSRYKKQDFSDGVRTEAIGVLDERPERFGMLVAPTSSLRLTGDTSGQPVFLVDSGADVEVRRQGEPVLDEEGEELVPYWEDRYYQGEEHDHEGEPCVTMNMITRGRHRKSSNREFFAAPCPVCSVLMKLSRITDPDKIAKLENYSEEES